MISGKDRGKSGKVLWVSQKNDVSRVMVEGLNLIKKHQRARKQGQKGQIISVERLVSISAVQLICKNCSRPTRVGYHLEGKKKDRICRKCQAVI